jgi:ankyrin repeat protein
VVVTEAMVTQASEAGDLVSLSQWSRQGVRVATAVPLICAARSGIVEVVRVLVTKLGADVNDERGDDGTTALIVAALNGHLDIVRFLVEL